MRLLSQLDLVMVQEDADAFRRALGDMRRRMRAEGFLLKADVASANVTRVAWIRVSWTRAYRP